MANKSRAVARMRRHARVRKNLAGTAERPRLNVFRSLTSIYVQVIDDQTGHTLAWCAEQRLTDRGHVDSVLQNREAVEVGMDDQIRHRLREQINTSK